jgi:hypothetical protein
MKKPKDDLVVRRAFEVVRALKRETRSPIDVILDYRCELLASVGFEADGTPIVSEDPPAPKTVVPGRHWESAFADLLAQIRAMDNRVSALEDGTYAGDLTVRPVCQCGAGPDRLSTWNEDPPGWDCRHCGGFVPRSEVTGQRGPHPSGEVSARNHDTGGE